MKKKKLAKRLILIFLAVLIVCCGYMSYTHSISIRIFSNYLTFRPFSGKLFNIGIEDIDSITILNDIDEYYRDSYGLIDYHGRSWELSPDQSRSEREEAYVALTKFVNALNDYRFYFYVPCDRDPERFYDSKWYKYGPLSLDPENDYVSIPPFYRLIPPYFEITFSYDQIWHCTCYIRKNWIWVSDDWVNYYELGKGWEAPIESPKAYLVRGLHKPETRNGAWYYGSSDLYDTLMALE